MTHLDDGQLLALRDDPVSVSHEARAHMEGCASCRAALDGSHSRAAAVAHALDTLDGDVPGPDVLEAMERARDAVRLRVAQATANAADTPSLTHRRARRAAWSASKAAGILLITAAGLSALPGSPVRSWLQRAAGGGAENAAAPLAQPEAAAAAEEAGIRLPLRQGPLAVVLSDVTPGTEIRVRWITGAEAAVFAPVGARFASGQGRMEARQVEGTVRVELPRSVLPVSLEVNGRIVLRNTQEGLVVSGPVVDQDDAGVTFRLPPP